MEVGDYVRTKSYGIAKILNTYNNTTTNYSSITLDIIDCFGRLGVSVGNNDIIKSNSNIIDLIERFDLVNGHLVICKMYEDEKDIPTIVKCVGDYYFKEEDIKSIVTKEQFESMEYKIER